MEKARRTPARESKSPTTIERRDQPRYSFRYAPADLSGGLKLLVQIAVFGLAVVTLIAAKQMRRGMIFDLTAVINTALLVVADR